MHKLSPQQIQFIKLLQIPTALLEQRIKQELEDNPALEEGLNEEKDEFKDDLDEKRKEEKEDKDEKDDEYEDYTDSSDYEDYLEFDETPTYKLSDNNYSADDEDDDYQSPVTVGTTFRERLMNQLDMLNVKKELYDVAAQIIGNLGDDGYLRREPFAIVDDLSFSQGIVVTEEQVLSALELVQQFDPSGVGARSLQECLLIQLSRKDQSLIEISTAIKIVERYFHEYSKKHYKKLLRHLKVTEDEMRAANEEILKLNPKPGNTGSDNRKSHQIIPDFVVHNADGKLELKLNARNAPELRISDRYREMLMEYKKSKKRDKSQKQAVTFVKQKLDSAKWFIDAVRQRQHTLLITMQAIIERQMAFFTSGDQAKLRPMILKDIAEEVSLDISTISRVANSKYVQTEFGTFLLKSFFSEGIKTDAGDSASSKEVKQILKDCIAGENKKKPLSDDKLAVMLKEKGYQIARRTVAKYREQLGIPVARLRKQI